MRRSWNGQSDTPFQFSPRTSTRCERARYFAKFGDRRKPAWYVYKHDPDDVTQAGRHFFLESIGIECVEAASYDAIYDSHGWRT